MALELWRLGGRRHLRFRFRGCCRRSRSGVGVPCERLAENRRRLGFSAWWIGRCSGDLETWLHGLWLVRGPSVSVAFGESCLRREPAGTPAVQVQNRSLHCAFAVGRATRVCGISHLASNSAPPAFPRGLRPFARNLSLCRRARFLEPKARRGFWGLARGAFLERRLERRRAGRPRRRRLPANIHADRGRALPR